MVSMINRTVAGAIRQAQLLRQDLAYMEGEKEVWRRKALALEYQLRMLQEQLAERERQSQEQEVRHEGVEFEQRIGDR